MSFNRTHSRAVIGLLTGHNTLRQHLYLLGVLDSPLCRKCGVTEETSAHILWECGALASLRHAHLGFFFLEPKDIQSTSLGAIWSFSKASGLPWLDMGHKGPALRSRCIGAARSQTLDLLILIPSLLWFASTAKIYRRDNDVMKCTFFNKQLLLKEMNVIDRNGYQNKVKLLYNTST